MSANRGLTTALLPAYSIVRAKDAIYCFAIRAAAEPA